MELKSAADQYLNDCFERESSPHVNELASNVGIDRVAFSRRFRAETGIAASCYLKQAQIARAMELLRTTDLPTNAIAYASAFGSRVTFFRTFKRLTGLSPHGYRSAPADELHKM